nr:MAG TPA: minor tail protein Z [Caudoviricetes sp.]DAX80695.1 MAG TPA: minor tail protein Z [Caudoviricetes sp.]
MAGSVSVQLANLRQLAADVQAIEAGGRKAITSTVKDVKARAPGWIAQEVTAVYNIKKGEITPSSGGKPKKMAGSIRITGETIEELTLTYKGRLLTPVHFGMTPKAPPKGKSYTLKVQVLKGSKKVLGRYKNTRTPGGPFSQRSHNILMGTGNTKEGGTNWIPFQRMSKTRTDIKKVTTISVPQMITSDRTNEAIMLRLNTETAKRLDHHMKRALGL